MRVLTLGINYHPEDTGIAPFTTGRCEDLATRGHDVTVCTGFPYYPQWRLRVTDQAIFHRRDVRAGVEILRSWLYVPSEVTSLRRILHEASFIASSTLSALRARRPDVIVTVSPPLGLALASVLLSARWRVPYVFHVPDLQPDAAFDLGMLRRGRIASLLYAVERLAYRRAAVVTTLTEAMRRRIVGKGIEPAKVEVLPDWADPGLLAVGTPPMDGRAFRAAEHVGDRFLVVHSGNMGVKQGLDVVLDAALRGRDDPNVLYLLVGDGAARPALEARARSLGLPNLRFLPLQPRARFLDMLAATDVALVTQQRVVADIVFPSKVITLLAAGRPVAGSLNGTSEVARVVTEAAAGLVVPAADGEALHGAVTSLREHPEARREMMRKGREYAQRHWDRKRVLDRWEALLSEVATGERRPGVTSRGSVQRSGIGRTT